MKGTLVTDDNLEFFLPILDKERNQIDKEDLIIGVIDDESGTACGVLRAAVQEKSELYIRYIYVHEDFRNKGAGKELVSFLIEVADAADANGIRCFYLRNEETRDLYSIFDGAGFADLSDELDEYLVRMSDFDLDALKGQTKAVKTFRLSLIPSSQRKALKLQMNSNYDEKLSLIATDKSGNKGVLLVSEFGDYLELERLESEGPDQIHILYAMIREALQGALDTEGRDRWLLVNAHSDMAKQLLKRLTGNSAIRYYDCILFSLKIK